MGEPSDDDVPTMTSASDLRRPSAPEGSAPSDDDDDAEDDPTVLNSAEMLLKGVNKGLPAAPPLGATPPRVAPPPMRPRSSSSPAPASGSSARPSSPPRAPPPSDPEPATSPKHAAVPRPAKVAVEAKGPDSVTNASRVAPPKLGLSPPKAVAIRSSDDEDESADETEVRAFAEDVSAVLEEARRKTAATAEADEKDDSITTMSPAAAPPPSTPDAPTVDGPLRVAPAKRGSKSDAYAGDDSVTTRGPATLAAYEDDSVTTQAPPARASDAPAPRGRIALPPAIDGETEGTTKKVHKRKPGQEAGSITAEQPAPLTNMLRVIASSLSSDGDLSDDETEDEMQAHTQVMANAPLKPSDLGATSESALRISGPDLGGGERATLGITGASPRERRISNMGGPLPSQETGPHMPPPTSTHAPFAVPAELERRPRYGLLVAVVAAISIAVPLVLFVVLSQPNDLAPRVTAQPSPDPVGRNDPARTRAGKPAPSATPSASATAVSTGGGGRRWPFRR